MQSTSKKQRLSGDHRLAISSNILIREARIGDDVTAFRTLNEEWITQFFSLEDKDRELLNDPGKHNPPSRRSHLHGLV